MRHSFPALRRAAVVIVAVLSFVGAIILVWSLATREHIGLLSNAQLVGMLALFLLPGATLAAWELDRRHRRATDQGQPEDSGVHLHSAAGSRDDGRHRRRLYHGADEPVGR